MKPNHRMCWNIVSTFFIELLKKHQNSCKISQLKFTKTRRTVKMKFNWYTDVNYLNLVRIADFFKYEIFFIAKSYFEISKVWKKFGTIIPKKRVLWMRRFFLKNNIFPTFFFLKIWKYFLTNLNTRVPMLKKYSYSWYIFNQKYEFFW